MYIDDMILYYAHRTPILSLKFYKMTFNMWNNGSMPINLIFTSKTNCMVICKNQKINSFNNTDLGLSVDGKVITQKTIINI